jgi:hypothetical protein
VCQIDARVDDEVSESELELDPYMEGGAYKLEGGHWQDILAPVMNVVGDGLLAYAAGMGVDEPEEFSTSRTEPEPIAHPQGEGFEDPTPVRVRDSTANPLARGTPTAFTQAANAAIPPQGLLSHDPAEEPPGLANASSQLRPRREPAVTPGRAKRFVNKGVDELANKAADKLNLRRRYMNEQWIGEDGKKGYLRRVAPRATVASLGIGLTEGASTINAAGTRRRAEESKKVTACVDDLGALPGNECKDVLDRNGINPSDTPAGREQRERASRDAALAADWQRTRDRSENPYLN